MTFQRLPYRLRRLVFWALPLLRHTPLARWALFHWVRLAMDEELYHGLVDRGFRKAWKEIPS